MWGAVSYCYPDVAKLTTQINNGQHHNKTASLTSPLAQKKFLHFGHFPRLLHPSPSCLRCSSLTSYEAEQGPEEENTTLLLTEEQYQESENKGLWKKWREKSGEMSSKLAKLGLAAVLAYGLFDAVTYTSFFVLAFLGYEKSTGQNPAANLKALVGIVILMWTGNNVTRPFRVAGAAALAPVIDKGLKKIQKYFNFSSLFNAFALVVGIVAAPCLTVVGLLILSRWGK